MLKFILSNNSTYNHENPYFIHWKYNELNETYFLLYHPDTLIDSFLTKNRRIYIIGDLLSKKEDLIKLIPNNDSQSIEEIRNLNGLFYIIEHNLNTDSVNIYNSVFSILPLFISKEENCISISSYDILISKFLDITFKIDKRFILEQLLFNYPIFNNSIATGIETIPGNSFLSLQKDTAHINKHTKIEDYFTKKSLHSKKSIRSLSLHFIEMIQDYFPAELFQISFTGGFDGRTILACAKNNKKEFKAFSFGTKSYNDVTIPLESRKRLQIDFEPIFLDTEKYLMEDFEKSGMEISQLTGCQSSYIYSHFIYSAKKISVESKYLMAGYFGSELFRAPHFSGAIIPKAVFDVIIEDDISELKGKLWEAKTLSFLNKQEYKEEFEELFNEIIQYKIVNSNLSKQRFLYKFIFEEAFRKVFGNWIRGQFEHIIVRSPYLNFKFIAALLKTSLAGVNNDFKTKNPLKRLKGQLLYAEIIRTTCPELYKEVTGKGYKPKDLMSFWGNLKIVYPFFKKRIQRKTDNKIHDILSIAPGIKNLQSGFKVIEKYPELFNVEKVIDHLNKIEDITDERIRDAVIMVLTQSQFITSNDQIKK